MPSTEIKIINLSIIVSLYNADNRPNNKPRNNAIQIDVMANRRVLPKLFLRITLTGIPLRIKDSLRYGVLRTMI